MKKLFYLIFIFYFIEMNAQTDKNFILRTSLGYHFDHKDNLDASSDWNTNYLGGINYHEISSILNAGKKFKSNLYYGLGIIYNRSKQEINPNVKFPDTSGAAYVYMAGFANTKSITNSYSPIIFVQYYQNLFEKISISMDLYAKYSYIKNSVESVGYIPDLPNNRYVKSGYESKMEFNQHFLAIGVSPSLRFNIYKNLGMELSFGRIEYSQKIKDSRVLKIENKTKELEIGFKPENWLIGFYINL